MTLPYDYWSVSANSGLGAGYGYEHRYIHECVECFGVYESKGYTAGLCEECTPSPE